jgi:hypothetical protein
MLAILADYTFFLEHGSNAASVAALALNFIDFADAIFRASDFDGLTNIGIGVAKVEIFAQLSISFIVVLDHHLHLISPQPVSLS